VTFADTSFWIALRNGRDPHHAEARALFEQRADAGLVTSNQVRGETWTYLRRRAGHSSAVDFLDALDRSPRLRVVLVDEKLELEALRWLRRHDEREYSFVDATSFATMRSLRLREALAFDGDFTAAGFVELRVARRS
jgi:predicted nucleic acid-binding protein